jgi:hypothetical protein
VRASPSPVSGAAALDVRRPATVGQVGQGGLDPPGREVGAPLADLCEGRELGLAYLPRLLDDSVGEGGVVLAAVEDEADGVVPAAPGREPVGQQEGAGVDLKGELLLDLAGGGELR